MNTNGSLSISHVSFYGKEKLYNLIRSKSILTAFPSGLFISSSLTMFVSKSGNSSLKALYISSSWGVSLRIFGSTEHNSWKNIRLIWVIKIKVWSGSENGFRWKNYLY